MKRSVVSKMAKMTIVGLCVALACTAHADENGQVEIERRCYDPGIPILENPTLGGVCTEDGDCGDGEECGGCDFLGDVFRLVVMGINELCEELPDEQSCLSTSSQCQKVTQELFAGTTLAGAPGDTWACREGGRGQIMGEAAICLLRELSQSIDGPESGIHNAATIGMDVFGESKVKQRIGFKRFDREARTMEGYHSVSLCLPVVGCIDHQKQPFTARLFHSDQSGLTCGDLAVASAWGLEVEAKDSEHLLDFEIPAIKVPTPIGVLAFTPRAHYHTYLKHILPPYVDLATFPDADERFDRIETSECPFACVPASGIAAELTDIYGRTPGAMATAAGTAWQSQTGLGGRSADTQEGTLWDPEDDRPDLDLGRVPGDPVCACQGISCPGGGVPTPARNDAENLPAGDAEASLDIALDLRDTLGFLFPRPLLLRELGILVRPRVGTSFASQFDALFSEGLYQPFGGEFGCKADVRRSIARLTFPNAVTARAFFETLIRFGFRLKIDLGSFGRPTIINIHPEWKPLDVHTVRLSKGPEAGARSDADAADGTPAPLDPGYDAFASFRGPTDGEAFVHECLEGPAPPEQPEPEPAYTPGDPDDLLKGAFYPCNVCVAYGGVMPSCTYDPARIPAGLSEEEIEALTDSCDFVDGVCRHVGADGVPDGLDDLCLSASVDLRDLPNGDSVAPAAQTLIPVTTEGLPPEQRWTCDGPAKNGCFDLCTYDAQAAQPYAVRYSAVTSPDGARCAGAHTPEPCNDGDSCDDGNPCTDDFCVPELGCLNRPNTAPCNDGLFCTGADQCGDGTCSTHAGNPCFGHGPATDTCDEGADACTFRGAGEACANGADDNGDGLVDCADPLCGGDPCQCRPINRDPGTIRFAAAAGVGDYLGIHGAFAPCADRALDPDGGEIGVLLSNANGPVYSATLAPGALTRRSERRWAFRDTTAQRNRNGLARVDLVHRPRDGQWRFRLKAYGAFDAATEALMTFQVRVGSQAFVNTSTWRASGRGWQLTLPGER